MLSSIDEQLVKSCGMTSEEVGRRLLSNKVVLVDIRPANEFESYRISGSLNLPPFEIKQKSFLKSRHLIIVGNKSSMMDAGLLCHELKLQGFKKVNFVSGGIGSWNKELVGRDAGSIDRWTFGKITARKFASLRTKMKWMVLDLVDDLSEKNDESSYGDLKVESFRIGTPESIDIINNYINTFSGTTLFGVLIVADNEEHYSRIESSLSKRGTGNIFYLDGGRPAFNKYWAERKMFLARLKRGPLVPSPCGNT
ncbi:MAG: rhodanese-like domain-containing protein [Gammaproteobacteria bacterium]|nr:rhodanese-like domain-containing protein [Gammaproteobacteria bacterium]